MRLKYSPDFAQAAMENVLHNLKATDAYIDTVRAFSDNWESHTKLIDEALGRLRENRSTINPLKCEWVAKKTDWLEWIGHAMQLNYTCSLTVPITTKLCGQVQHTYFNI
eukprot:15325078-Ditylum_brightwellii.AAC.1